LSAYDLFHGLIPNGESFFNIPELLFIDSGAYELSSQYDLTEPNQPPRSPLAFRLTDYRQVLKALPPEAQVVVSNFDWGTRKKTVEEQIASANLFSPNSRFLANFIVKPGRSQFLDIDDVIRNLGRMRHFDVIGVTEKELGDSLIDRLRAIAKLRLEMDRKNMPAPIHIWGGLDPVITPLYFFAGAELFDGVSWLRYAYHEGVAVYRQSSAVLSVKNGLSLPDDHVRSLSLGHNLLYLRDLTIRLRTFVDSGGRDFSIFGVVGPVLNRSYNDMLSNIKQLRGSK
jgi:hypothetical protein